MNSKAKIETIHRVIEGCASEDDAKSLSGMLKSDGHLLDLYCEEIETCASLEWHFLIEKDFGAVLHRKRELTEDLLVDRRRRFRWFGMAAAAVILFCVGLVTYLVNAEPRVSASLVANSEADWKVYGADGKPTANDTLGKGSRVELSRGALEISFSNGVDAILEGQASLVVEDAKLVRLVEGRMHVQCGGRRRARLHSGKRRAAREGSRNKVRSATLGWRSCGGACDGRDGRGLRLVWNQMERSHALEKGSGSPGISRGS